MSRAGLDFYCSPGAMTALPGHPALADLPTGLDGLRNAVQGLLLHREWAPAYGIDADAIRVEEQNLRSSVEVLGRAFELSAEPVTVARAPADRVLCICRHFALLYTALLRSQGVPSRVRCGFSTYFDPVKFYDHWITERWDGNRWARDDPQIDKLQAQQLDIDFDPHDQPPGKFLTASEAWTAARAGEVAPSLFGIYDMWGMGFVAGNVVSDFACLNKVELLPWDSWGMKADPYRPPPPGDIEVLDNTASLSMSDDLDAIRDRFEGDGRLNVPRHITSYINGEPVEVHLVF